MNTLVISFPPFKFQSTLPAGGATFVRIFQFKQSVISIHAPRGGSDVRHPAEDQRFGVISIHAPRGGSDKIRKRPDGLHGHFNPRSPRGERHRQKSRISSGDLKFQSTLPAGGATRSGPESPMARSHISIHAPRGGSDTQSASCTTGIPKYFNPRSPRGERLTDLSNATSATINISIHAPRGGSDEKIQECLEPTKIISIHAPRGGSDQRRSLWLSGSLGNFNPRSPRGERQQKCMFFMREFIHIP